MRDRYLFSLADIEWNETEGQGLLTLPEREAAPNPSPLPYPRTRMRRDERYDSRWFRRGQFCRFGCVFAPAFGRAVASSTRLFTAGSNRPCPSTFVLAREIGGDPALSFAVSPWELLGARGRTISVVNSRCPRWMLTLTVMASFFFACVAHGESVDKLPKPTTYVSDFAGVVDSSSKQSIEDFCRQVYEKAHATIVVVTINSLDGVAIEDFDPA